MRIFGRNNRAPIVAVQGDHTIRPLPREHSWLGLRAQAHWSTHLIRKGRVPLFLAALPTEAKERNRPTHNQKRRDRLVLGVGVKGHGKGLLLIRSVATLSHPRGALGRV